MVKSMQLLNETYFAYTSKSLAEAQTQASYRDQAVVM